MTFFYGDLGSIFTGKKKKTMERSFVPLDDLFFILVVIEVFRIKILVQVNILIHVVMLRKGSSSN